MLRGVVVGGQDRRGILLYVQASFSVLDTEVVFWQPQEPANESPSGRIFNFH